MVGLHGKIMWIPRACQKRCFAHGHVSSCALKTIAGQPPCSIGKPQLQLVLSEYLHVLNCADLHLHAFHQQIPDEAQAESKEHRCANPWR